MRDPRLCFRTVSLWDIRWKLVEISEQTPFEFIFNNRTRCVMNASV